MKNTTTIGLNRGPSYRRLLSSLSPGLTKFAIFIMVLYASGIGYSQYYDVNQNCTTSFDDIVTTGTPLVVNGDGHTFNSGLPFDFNYFGQNYTTPAIKISMDGYIMWNTTTGSLTNDNLPLPVNDPDINTDGAIYPFWDYGFADVSTTAGVYVQTKGTAPNRVYIVQWEGMQKVLDETIPTYSTGTVTYQVLFYETTNEIKFVYKDTFYGNTIAEGSENNDGGSSTIGLQKGGTPDRIYQTSFDNSAILLLSYCISYQPAATTSGCTMACNTTNIGIPANCQPTLIAKDFLTTSYDCATSFIIQLLETPTGPILEQGIDSLKADGFTATGIPYPLVNKSYVIRIVENIAGGSPNSCWNWHKFQDNIPPQITCKPADTVFCYEPLKLYSLASLSDCSGALTAHVIDSTYTQFNCSTDPYLLGKITRKYYLTDLSGNISDTCQDTLFLAPPSRDSIEFPANVGTLQCSDTFEKDAQGHPLPSVTGVPKIKNTSINLYPSTLASLCNMTTQYSDKVLPMGCGIKIMRRWVTYFWTCAGDDSIAHVQDIIISDTVPPVVTAPADQTISTGQNCKASFTVAPATITDDCNHLGIVTVTHPNGVSYQNGGFTITNLSVGTFNIIYSVNDGCGHIVRDTMKLTVQDQTAPVAICKEAIVSLDNTGVGRMYASSINNGSHDNGCDPVTIKVRRMNPDCNGAPDQTAWADYIDFYCCDMTNNPIQVILQATDAGGLTNTCMTTVTVQNKNTPIIANILPDITVPCGTYFDTTNLAQTFGKYVTDPAARQKITIDGIDKGWDGLVTGICTATVSETTPSISIQACGFGTITRHFLITDGGSFQQTVSQTITVNFDGIELKKSDFNAPLDYVTFNGMCSPEDIANADLGSQYIPSLKSPLVGCHNIMMNKEDKVFTSVKDACYKIVRTWTIIDWCLAAAKGNQYALDHAVTFTHALVVMNTTAPEFLPHADQIVETNNCTSDDVTVTTSATDDCPSNYLTYEWELDLNYNGVTATWDYNGNGNTFTQNMPVGKHRVHFAVTDGCGNLGHQFFLIEVKNVKKPTPVYAPLVTDLMANLQVNIPARFFNYQSSGACSSSNPLRFAYSTDPADSVRTFDCSFGVDTAHKIAVYVIDANGLYDLAYVDLTLNDNIVPCPNTITVISGQIVTEGSAGIPQVEVNAHTNMSRLTDDHGLFAFNNVHPGETYNIQPKDDNNPLNGVTTGDIIKIQNHILSKTPLPTPYKIIAADVNEDKAVTISDIVMIRKMILGKIDQFSSGKSWKFIDKSYAFADPTRPLKENYPQSIPASTTGHLDGVDFIGVKMGDVNGDFTLNLSDSKVESRNVSKLTVENTKLKAGEVTPIHFVSESYTAIQGLQAAFFLNAKVKLVGIESQLMEEGNENYLQTGNDLKLSLSSGEALNDNLVMTLYLMADDEIELSDAIQLNPDGFNSELYDSEGNANSLELAFTGNDSNLLVEQNIPNPFSDQTQISFTLGSADYVIMKIYDINGKVLKYTKGFYSKGRNTINLENGSIKASGVMFYEITSNKKTVTKKMVKLK